MDSFDCRLDTKLVQYYFLSLTILTIYTAYYLTTVAGAPLPSVIDSDTDTSWFVWSTSRVVSVQVGQTVLDCYITIKLFYLSCQQTITQSCAIGRWPIGDNKIAPLLRVQKMIFGTVTRSGLIILRSLMRLLKNMAQFPTQSSYRLGKSTWTWKDYMKSS